MSTKAPHAAVEQAFLERLAASLDTLVPNPRRCVVALSGGLDSSVLLAATARLAARQAFGLRALHVDHGLHSDSAVWDARCAALAASLGVAYASLTVTVERRGKGLEAAARDARYAALAAHLAPGETLLTAHHADDQLETVMLRVVRGAGVRGLRGILPARALGAGRLARPLLGFTRAEIHAVAAAWRLDWVEDPSNARLDFDRNLVRERIVPVLRDRWGEGVARAASRLGASMSDASAILDERADEDLAAAHAQPRRIPLAGLRRLDAARQRNALLRSIRLSGLPSPDMHHLDALCRLIATDADEERRVEWRGAQARLFRGALHWLESPVESPLEARGDVAEGRLRLDGPWRWADGRLMLEPVSRSKSGAACGLPESWAREGLDVRFRVGGERIKPYGDVHHRTLKYLFQQRGVVPWMRNRIPLLYRGPQLVAIADLVLDDGAARAAPDEPRWRVRWLDGPAIE